uniref:THIF-type NAD/FAD binding fold domain-containing protein n=1 Tax=Globisporangium ultimum (strain ATCC 200006 / CBS 805.95 / DAOM BR144) TaxID=431595 RepID=K3W7Z7_GLOUD
MVKTQGFASLVAAFGIGAAAAIAAQLAYAAITKKRVADKSARSGAIKRMVADNKAQEGGSRPVGSDAMEDALQKEQLSRIHTFFGEEGFEKIKNAFVIVVGVGGVGSHAAHMLARSGVGKLRLIDFDNVTLSSLNRHAVATRADVGTPKVTAMKKHLHEIVPQCEIEDLAVMFEEACADELLEGNPTYVLDCIDDVNTKLALLVAVSQKNLKVITATGAGAKADPTRLQIGSLSDAVRDPLATKMRYFLKKKKVSTTSITTVFSSEKSVCKLLPLDEEQAQNPSDFGNVENFRIRVIPVLGTMPALFGQTMAAYVLCDLANQPFVPEAVARLSRDQRNKLYQKLLDRERVLGIEHGKMELEKDEIEFIFQEVWRGRSSVSGVRQGGHQRMFMARWRADVPLRPDNVVFLTTKELNQFDKDGGIHAFGDEVLAKIDARLQQFGDWDLDAK